MIASRWSHRAVFVALVATKAGVSACAERPADPVDAWVESYMREREVPGLALAILEGGRIVKTKGYGLANIEHDVPVTPATVFESASLGKQFTAAAILLLVRDGQLVLEDPISRYLSGSPDAWSSVTVRHLLTHTSGIPEYEQDPTLNLRLDYSEEELLQTIARRPLLFAPGEAWSYTNSGYVLLGMIIRTLTGEHWGEFLRKRMFEPLGMETARVISHEEIIANRAAGYEVVDGRLRNREVIGPGWNTTADGSVLLSVLDLAKWDSTLYGNAFLDDAAKTLMWTPARLNDGSPASYGFEWFLADAPGRRTIEHPGDGWGFKSYMGRFLEDSLTVILLSNSTSMEQTTAGHTIAGLLRPALAQPDPVATQLSAEVLGAYVGDYRFPSGEVLHVSRTPDGIDVSGDIPLGRQLAESEDVFFSPDWLGEARLVFVRGPAGEVEWLHTRRHPSWPTRARRVR